MRDSRSFPPLKGHADHAGMAGRDQCAPSSCCCAASAFWPVRSRRRSTVACRPTRRPSVTPGSSAMTRTAGRFLSREGARRRFRRAVLRGRQRCYSYRAGSRNQPAEFTETRFPLVEEAGFAHRSRRARSSGAEAWATRSTIARSSIVAPSSPPTGCGSAATGSTAARPAAVLRHRRCRRRRDRTRRSGRWRAGAQRARSCTSSPPAAAAGAIRWSASPQWCSKMRPKAACRGRAPMTIMASACARRRSR